MYSSQHASGKVRFCSHPYLRTGTSMQRANGKIRVRIDLRMNMEVFEHLSPGILEYAESHDCDEDGLTIDGVFRRPKAELLALSIATALVKHYTAHSRPDSLEVLALGAIDLLAELFKA
ncbi:hypothetical protein SCHPADRAFT_906860 [Schizopora paradoxa]|uniref:Uncharacterized protein n=1 Tax=Schizopora paradoxa TaxID=27342 RepID=A0A0H2RFB9_9AGAM|nr:hypothetical protein SCHPADRAFT_906860 [Schizopora paradoxa]